MELTKAIPPAAAVPARSAVGTLQKIDKQAMIPTIPTVAAATEIHVFAPYAALNPRPKQATALQISVCQRRSRVRSELRPASSIPTMATALGIAVRSPMVKALFIPVLLII